jgi:hypothetical protein
VEPSSILNVCECDTLKRSARDKTETINGTLIILVILPLS